MQLNGLDWSIIVGFFAATLFVGLAVAARAGRSSSEFFLSGRGMPWWLLGTSMVATTFAVDTPLLVTDIVRNDGVAGNWVWWAFLLTGMLTVFVYAKLWRRSGVSTDIEFYEMRYSGRSAAFLRGFRALYLGVFFNIVIMANVTLAAVKIGQIMFGFTAVQTVLVASLVTVVFSAAGGFRGVLLTDFLLFVVAMIGAIGAAVVAVGQPQVGGLATLLSHEAVREHLSILPDFSNKDMVITVLVIPLAVQWWSVWYPGAEPGGGGYIAQRMLAAKDEQNAVGATLLFNFAHYAMRPWPWILVGLASLIVFPDLASIRAAFPHADPSIIRNDSAYPAMLTLMPHGLIGLVTASLVAAYMSTISTHLNWGSSYVVFDFYKRFVKPKAHEKELVLVGRVSTVVMMIAAGLLTTQIESAKHGFDLLLQIGAGTGLLFILRWFWWRINPISELTAMVVSFVIAVFFFFYDKGITSRIRELVETGMDQASAAAQVGGLGSGRKLVLSVAITTLCWLLVALVTKPSDDATLRRFCRVARPGGPGWKPVYRRADADGDPIPEAAKQWTVPMGIACMVAGCFAVYSALFATGYWLYGSYMPATVLTVVAITSAVFLARVWPSVSGE